MAMPKRGAELMAEIDAAEAVRPNIWWLGHSGFAIKFRGIVFYIDPLLSERNAVIEPAAVRNADLILCTHAHPRHLDPGTVTGVLAASSHAKLVLPKSAAEQANAMGISYTRMTTTDSDLRVEYFKRGMYVRIYAIPSAHPELSHTALGGYPYLGYLIRCGNCTIYHAGDCVPYDGLVQRLRPYNVTVALLPIGGAVAGTFTVEEAAQLCADIGARWLVPAHYVPEDACIQHFVDHMLFERPEQRFKVFACGEGWRIPEE